MHWKKSSQDKPPTPQKTHNPAAMFNDIAPHYDFLNHFFSLNTDRRWRKKLACRIAQQHPATILDVATGTGDLAIALLRETHAAVTAVDISEGMLAIAKRKTIHGERRFATCDLRYATGDGRPEAVASRVSHIACRRSPVACRLSPAIKWLQAPAEALPFPDHAFAAVTVAFGVRNFENLAGGLREMYRVLQPGGTVAILEFTTPARFPVKQLYRFYFHSVMPLTGRLFSGHRTAYRYLPASVSRFPQRDEFLQLLQQAGFKHTRCQSLSCGIAALYTGESQG
ncbi:MAG: class I SAM-dependent methyltransferase [Prevotellaceae bacterium]|nr:class I SAM-dependent methyltransferase [Prevotellaceae bacterium]